MVPKTSLISKNKFNGLTSTTEERCLCDEFLFYSTVHKLMAMEDVAYSTMELFMVVIGMMQ